MRVASLAAHKANLDTQELLAWQISQGTGEARAAAMDTQAENKKLREAMDRAKFDGGNAD